MIERYDRYGFDSSCAVWPSVDHGPLRGMRVAVKDVFDIAGQVSGAGNPDFASSAPRAMTHASAVSRVLDAGAMIAGKTVCDELAFSLMGRNVHYGTPLNTHAPGRLPGGSSSGSAAIVAAGLVDAALGTDTSGSVRVPASYCGVFGMRPTWGRVDMTGVVPLAPGFDTVGWFARDARTLACLGDVLLPRAGTCAQPEISHGYRLSIVRDAFALLDDDVRAALTFALDTVSDWFTTRIDMVLSDNGLDTWANVYRIAQAVEVWGTHGHWYTTARPHIDAEIDARLQACREIAAARPPGHSAALSAVRARIAEAVSEKTILCLPSAPDVAPLLTAGAQTLGAERARLLALTCAAGLGGLPQISLPLGRRAGCPIGLSLIGPRGSDRDLLRLATRVDTLVSLSSY